MIASYWYYRPLVPKNDLRDPCRYDADPELARVIAFDDGDIGKANALFDLLAHAIEGSAALPDQRADRHAGNAGGRPEEHLRDSVLSNNLSLDLIGIDFKILCQVNAESQAIQEGARAQDATMPRADAGNIGEGI